MEHDRPVGEEEKNGLNRRSNRRSREENHILGQMPSKPANLEKTIGVNLGEKVASMPPRTTAPQGLNGHTSWLDSTELSPQRGLRQGRWCN